MKIFIFRVYCTIELKRIFLYKQIFGTAYLVNSLRWCWSYNISNILDHYGASIGQNIHFKRNLSIDNFSTHSSKEHIFTNLHIGDNSYMGLNVFLDLAEKIVIGKDTVISSGVTILTHSDVGNRMLQTYYKRIAKEVDIEEGAWIGANSTIMPGVKIGKCAIVAAGSLVLEDVSPYTVVAGVPAIFKKKVSS